MTMTSEKLGPLMAGLQETDVVAEWEPSGKACRLSWRGVDLGRYVVDDGNADGVPVLVKVTG